MIVSITSTGSDDILRRLREIGQPAARKALAATAEGVEDIVTEWAGRHTRQGKTTGALGRSVFARHVGDGDAWEVGHDLQVAPHALFVHWGTRPHKIVPRNKRMLRRPGLGPVAG